MIFKLLECSGLENNDGILQTPIPNSSDLEL